MQGGDLMRAISTDTKNELRWSRKGGLLMLDIARGLAFLHANKVTWQHWTLQPSYAGLVVLTMLQQQTACCR